VEKIKDIIAVIGAISIAGCGIVFATGIFILLVKVTISWVKFFLPFFGYSLN